VKVTQKVSLTGGEKEPARAFSAADQILADLFRAVNGISVGTPSDGQRAENLDAVWLVYTTNGVANTDDIKRHKLGRVPVGFFQAERPNRVADTPNSGQVYFGAATAAQPSATSDQVTLRCTTASKQVYVLLF